jgi:multisite-specific tRNA:(cytosine-C5)-methyltransferase
MVFPLWKSLHSLNLMLPKEDRKALLLRLFNDDTPLVNLSQGHARSRDAKVETKVQSSIDGQEEAKQRRNSSSEEAEPPAA